MVVFLVLVHFHDLFVLLYLVIYIADWILLL